MTFVNFSNHSSDKWNPKQIEAASKWGSIIDLPFPEVSADASVEDIRLLACDYTDQICSLQPNAVMCQGEFTLTFAIVTMLKSRGITVVSACSSRNTVEAVSVDGTSQKTSIFEFVKFREY